MNQQAKKRQFPYVTVALIVILALVAVVVVFSVLDSVGITGKLGTAAKSDNFRVSDNELTVYEYQVGLSQLANEWYYAQIYQQSGSSSLASSFPDAQSYAYYMLPYYLGSGAFSEQAHAYAQQYLVYCEGAKEAGVEMEEEDWKELETYMEGLATTADSGDMSLRSFIHNYIGKGVSEGEVRSAMEKYYLAVKYAEILDKEFSDAVTDKEMEDFREENKGSFYTTKYHSYVLVNESLAEKAKECKTIEELKAIIIDYYVESKFANLYKDHITNAKVETEDNQDTVKAKVTETLKAMYELGEDLTKHYTSDATDAYLKAGYKIVDSIKSNLDTQFNAIKKDQSTAYVDLSDEAVAKNATDLQKWLFGEGRKAGDVNVIKVESTSSSSSSSSSSSTTKTTTHTWYVVTDVMVLDTEKTKDAYYIQLADDKDKEAATGATTEAETGATSGEKLTAEQKADAMFKALEADKTTEKFDELAKKYGMTTSTALKENISKKSVESTAKELAEWLYAEGRKEGDIQLIKTGDSTPKYFVVYFVEENEETWKVNARAGITSEKVQEWFEAGVEKYNVTVDTKAPETTAEAATA